MGSLSLKRAAEMCAQEFTVGYSDGSEEKIWVRTPSEADIREAELEFAKERLVIRESYRPGQVLYESLALELDALSPITLAGIAVRAEAVDIMQRVRRETPMPMPFDPSKFRTTPDREKARERHEADLAEWEKQFEARVQQFTSAREDELAKEPREAIVESALRLAVQAAVSREIENLDVDLRVLRCVRRPDDHSQPYFDTLDEVRELPTTLRESLMAAMNQVDAVRPVDIKNSQGRSVLGIGPAASILEAGQDPSTPGSQAPTSRRTRRRGGPVPS